MRWSSFERGKKLRLGRLAGSRQKRVYEIWVCRCDRDQCRLLNGQRFLRGRGPQPRVTTPEDCQCVRVPVPARRALREARPRVARRLARLAGQGFDVSSAERVGASFVAQSCKDE